MYTLAVAATTHVVGAYTTIAHGTQTTEAAKRGTGTRWSTGTVTLYARSEHRNYKRGRARSDKYRSVK